MIEYGVRFREEMGSIAQLLGQPNQCDSLGARPYFSSPAIIPKPTQVEDILPPRPKHAWAESAPTSAASVATATFSTLAETLKLPRVQLPADMIERLGRHTTYYLALSHCALVTEGDIALKDNKVTKEALLRILCQQVAHICEQINSKPLDQITEKFVLASNGYPQLDILLRVIQNQYPAMRQAMQETANRHRTERQRERADHADFFHLLGKTNQYYPRVALQLQTVEKALFGTIKDQLQVTRECLDALSPLMYFSEPILVATQQCHSVLANIQRTLDAEHMKKVENITEIRHKLMAVKQSYVAAMGSLSSQEDNNTISVLTNKIETVVHLISSLTQLLQTNKQITDKLNEYDQEQHPLPMNAREQKQVTKLLMCLEEQRATAFIRLSADDHVSCHSVFAARDAKARMRLLAINQLITSIYNALDDRKHPQEIADIVKQAQKMDVQGLLRKKPGILPGDSDLWKGLEKFTQSVEKAERLKKSL